MTRPETPITNESSASQARSNLADVKDSHVQFAESPVHHCGLLPQLLARQTLQATFIILYGL